MGLLHKTNPNATWRSVTANAISGAILIPAVMILGGVRRSSDHWWGAITLCAIIGASVFALAEWQVDVHNQEPGDDASPGR